MFYILSAQNFFSNQNFFEKKYQNFFWKCSKIDFISHMYFFLKFLSIMEEIEFIFQNIIVAKQLKK